MTTGKVNDVLVGNPGNYVRANLKHPFSYTINSAYSSLPIGTLNYKYEVNFEAWPLPDHDLTGLPLHKKRDAPVTLRTPGTQLTIDYIWYSSNYLRPVKLLEIPNEKNLPFLPCKEHPSDHLSLMCEFEVKDVFFPIYKL